MAAIPQGTTTRSIKYALGPQFGTIAFAGAILTLVDLARSATDQVSAWPDAVDCLPLVHARLAFATILWGAEPPRWTEIPSMLQARQSSRDGGNILMSLLACVLE